MLKKIDNNNFVKNADSHLAEILDNTVYGTIDENKTSYNGNIPEVADNITINKSSPENIKTGKTKISFMFCFFCFNIFYSS